MKQAFIEGLHLSKPNVQRLALINKIIEEYAAQGYRLTLRQLYYQLVSRDIISNDQREYAKVGNLLTKGRMAGVVDWNAIEDRIRKPHIPYWVTGISDAINDTVQQYRLSRQDGQDVYIEVWVEKDALSGVLRRITEHYHINLMVNRGYSSTSAMYDAFQRFQAEDRPGIILYLGDHDPSGLDMIRDVKDRLEQFGMTFFPAETLIENPDLNEGTFSIEHMALTKEQIDQYNPPPNPAKMTDSRAADYVVEHGRTSWEVDALPPETLNKLVSDKIESLIDMDLFQDMLDKEKSDKKEISKRFAD